MKKPLAELIEKDLETVEDVIEALMQVPKDYMLHPLGQKCQLGVDYYHECAYLEDPNCIGEYTYDVAEDAKRNGEPAELEIPDEKLVTYQPKLYVVMGYVDLCGNGNHEAVLQGIFSTEQKAHACGEQLTASGNVHHYEIECPLLNEMRIAPTYFRPTSKF